MCVLSTTQVLASAFSKTASETLSILTLVRYNSLLQRTLKDYFNALDLPTIADEIESGPSVFSLANIDTSDVAVRVNRSKFNYNFYRSTIPEDVVLRLETVEIPA